MEVLLAASPLFLVVVLMAGPWPLPATIALPVTVLWAGLVRLLAYGDAPIGLAAASVAGLIAAATPILIVAGAVVLFQVLDRCGALVVWRAWLDSLNPHPVARLMTVAWAFVYLIEGASGFGTPAALAAPILVACGIPAVRAAMVCLIFDTVPVTFGAVGTPVWFGLGELPIDDDEILTVGARAALINAGVAIPVVLLGLALLLRWATIVRSLPFILLAVGGCVVPAALVARFGSEFPSLIGGGVGLLVTVAAARWRLGLGPVDPADRPAPADRSVLAARPSAAEASADDEDGPRPPPLGEVLRAFSPLLLCVALLVLTRLPVLPLKAWLTAAPGTMTDLGWAQLGFGAGGTVVLEDLFGTGQGQGIQLLWVPGIVPFFLVALLTPWLLGRRWREILPGALQSTWQRLKGASLALLAGLVLVKLLQHAGATVPAATTILGQAMAVGSGSLWLWVAPWLGALGSFFSGSGTMSNLTFGPVQYAVAVEARLDPITVLALQTVGGGIGNMVCVHNIVAVTSILGLQRCEGVILRRHALPLVVALLAATAIALLLASVLWGRE